MKSKLPAYPYILWMVIFILVPLFLIGYFALTKTVDGHVVFTWEFIQKIFEKNQTTGEYIYLIVMWRSIWLAIICTVFCLLLGYPVAYILASKGFNTKGTLLFLFILPMWMNFLLRTYAWLTILERNGIINSFLTSVFQMQELKLLYNSQAIVFGMVYNYLPFMILPIHTVLTKMDFSMVEAAQDLGANNQKVFLKIVFPLSIPGVISGITMVFMPAVTTFIISDLLGGNQILLIGNLIEQQFSNDAWSFGSALSLMLMIIIILTMIIFSLVDKDGEGGVGI